MPSHARALLAAAVASAAMALPLRAEPGLGDWVAADEAEARLIAAVTAVAPGAAAVEIGVQLRISEGWRIYWRTPGAAGLAPVFDWSGSDNLAAAGLRWPAPARFEAFGKQSYGYAGEVIFPVSARLARPGEALALRLALSYLVCREVCIPGEASLALDLAAGPASPTAAAPELARHAARVPADAGAAGVAITARREPGLVTVIARSPEPFATPDLFLEWTLAPGHRRPDLPKPAVTLGDGGREAVFALPVQPRLVVPGTTVTVTVTDGARGVTADVIVAERN